MNSKTYISAGLALALGLAGSALAGGETSVGSAGAQELRIPVGARGTALMGSFLGDVHGVDAICWNPGGLVDLESNEATFGNFNYWADMDMVQFAAAHNFGNLGALGVSARVFNYGDLNVTTESQPDGTGEVLQPKSSIITLAWSRRISDRVALGMNANLVNQKVKDMSASGVAFDFGVQVETPMDGLSFGIVLKNFGANMKFSGYGNETKFIPDDAEPGSVRKTWTLEYQDFELPSSFQLGLAYDVMEDPINRLSTYAAFVGNNHSSDEYIFGAEYGFRNLAFGRFGYTYASNISDDATFSQDYLYTWSGGLGFRFDLGATDLFVDWSYTENKVFDATQWYTLRFAF
ncbi:MAG: PorV/PorQ family protein [Candidatus Delongbacteria bacterium]|nr:PorV/PorQ family protein [Candidatus Cloacimonadota bacterium]MCB9473751.1 PorV/PorQ family protein [Candidatus Delongbacteria bacterium]